MLTVKLMLKLTLELTLRLARGADAEADAMLKLAVQMELQVIPQLALKLGPSSHLEGHLEADARDFLKPLHEVRAVVPHSLRRVALASTIPSLRTSRRHWKPAVRMPRDVSGM